MTGYKKIFFDTNPIIYYLEDCGEFSKKITAFIDTYAESDFVTSTVTVTEYLTGAYRKDDEELAANFKGVISDYEFEVVPIDWNIAEEAARIRGKYWGFKTMDALQLAAAKLSGCDLFVSNDRQLKQYDGLDMFVVEEMV